MKVSYQEDVEIVNKRNTLDGIVLAINQAKEELSDIEKTKKEIVLEIKVLKDSLASAKDEFEKESLAISTSREGMLAELNSALSAMQDKKAELESVNESLKQAQYDLSSQKDNAEEAIKDHIKDLSSELESVKANIVITKAEFDKVSSDLDSVKVQKESLADEYAKMEKFISEADSKIKELNDQEAVLETSLDDHTRALFAARNEMEQKEIEYKELAEKSEALRHEISIAQTKKAELATEWENFTRERDALSREKLAFQTDRTMIMLREEFIKEKYALAGVPYK